MLVGGRRFHQRFYIYRWGFSNIYIVSALPSEVSIVELNFPETRKGRVAVYTFLWAANIEFIIDTYCVDKSPDTLRTRILAFMVVISASLVPFAVLFPPVCPPWPSSDDIHSRLIYANANDNAPAIIVSFVPAKLSVVVSAMSLRNEACTSSSTMRNWRYLLASRMGSLSVGGVGVVLGYRNTASLVCEAITATRFACEKARCALRKRRIDARARGRGRTGCNCDQA